MICVDTSSLVAFITKDLGRDVTGVENAFVTGQVVVTPVVVTEVLSSPKLDIETIKMLGLLPVLEIKEGFWSRAGFLRASLLKKGHKANLADTLIAQSCLDHNVPLITRDTDFKNFATHSNLQLI
ncbi:MAG: PIN domain-containing protein [Oligoflexia bacterium]|nr:PIN domain-containing protein [Oligoflexia bacterium]